MTVAEALLKKGWRVDVFWPDEALREKIKKKFSLDTDGVNYVPYSPRVNNLLNRWRRERNYNFLFYFSDGSIPFMFGKNNVLHFQVPFKKVLRKSLSNDLKLKTIKSIVCNSFFTKNVIDCGLKVDSRVIYPPVDIKSLKPLKKEDIIISVGRFSQLLQGKRQDVLVDAFKKFSGKAIGWKLILAGGNEIGSEDFLVSLKKKIENFPIEVIENPQYESLVKLYGRAKIFWTASGYGIDEETDPEKVEHFGMTTVEAMSAGCVPIVLGKGGQKEIVEEGETGFLWISEEELINKTFKVIKNPKMMSEISLKAQRKSRDFSKEKFYENIYNLV